MDSFATRTMSLELRSSNGSPDSSLELEGLYGELQKETPTKYVHEVPKALECAICYGTYKDAVILKQCGHSFCYICAIAALNNNKKCPLCKEAVKGKIESALTPNFAVRDQVDSLLIYCPYGLKKSDKTREWIVDDSGNSCQERIPLGKKFLHESECPFAIVKCDFKDDSAECKFVGLRKEIAEHQQNCEFKPIQCSVPGCTKAFNKKRLRDHEDACDCKEVSCDVCSARVKKFKITEHQCDFKHCPNSKYGCSEKFLKEEDLRAHLQINEAAHFRQMLETRLLGIENQLSLINNNINTQQVSSPRDQVPLPPLDANELIVDQSGEHEGAYTMIQTAIDAANPNDRILVYPGNYEESLVINFPVHIEGIGARGEIVVEPSDGNVLICNCSGGSITNLTLTKADNEERYAIRVASGSITIQRCNISSNGLSCIGIESACPKILHNDIHGSPQPGIMIFSGGCPLIEGNRIYDNRLSGVEVKEGANPIVRRNFIYQNDAGVYIHTNGLGLIENNRIYANKKDGIDVDKSSAPEILNNCVYNNGRIGVFVSDSNPKVASNQVMKNQRYGIWVSSCSLGKIEGNQIFENGEPGMTDKNLVMNEGCRAIAVNNAIS